MPGRRPTHGDSPARGGFPGGERRFGSFGVASHHLGAAGEPSGFRDLGDEARNADGTLGVVFLGVEVLQHPAQIAAIRLERQDGAAASSSARADRCRPACRARALGRGHVEQIVQHLERDAVGQPEVAQRRDLQRRTAGGPARRIRPSWRTGARSSWPAISTYSADREVEVAERAQLQHLAVGDVGQRRAEDVRDRVRVVGGDVLEDPGEEVVAGQHADAVAEVDRGGVHAAPRVGVVDDVVVDQRRDVDQLHVRGQRQMVAHVDRRTGGGRAEQREARAQALAARVRACAARLR